jgi:hypothetical protein
MFQLYVRGDQAWVDAHVERAMAYREVLARGRPGPHVCHVGRYDSLICEVELADRTVRVVR